MRKLAFLLLLCLALSPACLAEPSSADRLLSGLSQSWDALRDMAGEAGAAVSTWAEESGVNAWAEDTAGEISAWARENGLTEWTEGAMRDIAAWLDESGIAEWASGTSRDLQTFFKENGPAIEAWLAQTGEEAVHAWNTLTHPDGHTKEEVREAYRTVAESLEAAGQ